VPCLEEKIPQWEETLAMSAQIQIIFGFSLTHAGAPFLCVFEEGLQKSKEIPKF